MAKILTFLRSRIGNAVVFYVTALAAILWNGGVAQTATLASDLLSGFFPDKDPERIAVSVEALIWVMLVFGGIQAAIQIVVGKERFEIE